MNWLRSKSYSLKVEQNTEQQDKMDVILKGALVSNQTDNIKRALFQTIADKGSNQHHTNEIVDVLNLTSKWFLEGQTELETVYGLKIFLSWGKHNLNEFVQVFNKDYLSKLLSCKDINGGKLFTLIGQSMQLLQTTAEFRNHCSVIEAKASSYVREHPSIEDLMNFVNFLTEFKECLPKDSVMQQHFCTDLIHSLSLCVAPEEGKDIVTYIKNVEVVAAFLSSIWNTADKQTLLDCLKIIFQIISSPCDLEPSVCLGSLVRYLSQEMIGWVVKNVISNSSIDNSSMVTAIQRIIDWLQWPTSRFVDNWVIAFLKGLASVQKYTVLITVTENKVDQIFEKLQFVPVREPGLNIISHMLLSFQHSPEPFHMILPMVPKIIGLWKSDNSEQSQQLLLRLTELLHVLMYLHAGFPELYDPVYELIKEYPKPSADMIMYRLSESKWTAHCDSKAPIPMSYQPKAEMGKTGLFNLGNTCYMNSILQSLYMCDRKEIFGKKYRFKHMTYFITTFSNSLIQAFFMCVKTLAHIILLIIESNDAFHNSTLHVVFMERYGQTDRERVLSACLTVLLMSSILIKVSKGCESFRDGLLQHCPTQEQPLIVRLQYVFAFLRLSQRPVYAPVNFLSASRPPWFSSGCQQDCSEFLKFLLDQLHEQENNYLNKLDRLAYKRMRDKEEDSPTKHRTLIEKYFGGKLMTTYMCLKCGKESKREEMFMDLPLAFPEYDVTVGKKLLVGGNSKMSTRTINHSHSAHSRSPVNDDGEELNCLHLNDLLRHYLKPEKLIDDNKYYCDYCGGLQEAERKIKIVKSPEFLILTLLRFSYDTKLQSRSKIFCEVKYPKTLLLPVEDESAQTKIEDGDLLLSTITAHLGCSDVHCAADIYSLCSVVIHSGTSSDCGHYYCYARHSDAIHSLNSEKCYNEDDVDFLQDKWYLLNDSRVSYASYSSFCNVTQRFTKDTAYILIYKKIDISKLLSSKTAINANAAVQTTKADLQLRPDLRSAVLKDNRIFLQEQENAAAKQANKKHVNNFNWYNWKDDDDKGGMGPCGGGHLDDLDTSGSRFVF